jgi:predicted dinucleotide-binding enzyme
MRIAVLGTGEVGRMLAGRFSETGHEVVIGTRDVEKTLLREPGLQGRDLKPLPEAAAFGEVVVNAYGGTGTLEALREAGAANLDGKVLVDVSNPLDHSQGFPPTLFVKDTDSLAEQIQREFPAARVVKTLNTVNNTLMAYPRQLADGDHTVFVCGDDDVAKSVVSGLLLGFGWKDIFDLGPLANARGLEMMLPLWVRLYGAFGHPNFTFKLVR